MFFIIKKSLPLIHLAFFLFSCCPFHIRIGFQIPFSVANPISHAEAESVKISISEAVLRCQTPARVIFKSRWEDDLLERLTRGKEEILRICNAHISRSFATAPEKKVQGRKSFEKPGPRKNVKSWEGKERKV